MTRAVEYTVGARDDITAAVQWYEEAQPGLGVRFLDTVGATVAEIAAQPALGAPVDEATRRRVLRRFPYVSFYRVTDDLITVAAVAHAKREPDYWR